MHKIYSRIYFYLNSHSVYLFRHHIIIQFILCGQGFAPYMNGFFLWQFFSRWLFALCIYTSILAANKRLPIPPPHIKILREQGFTPCMVPPQSQRFPSAPFPIASTFSAIAYILCGQGFAPCITYLYSLTPTLSGNCRATCVYLFRHRI